MPNLQPATPSRQPAYISAIVRVAIPCVYLASGLRLPPLDAR